MSFAKAWNAAIALVDGKTKVARDILSDPSLELEGCSIATLQRRLETAVGTVVARENCRLLKQLLVDALRLEPEADGSDLAVFLEGQQQLTTLIEGVIADLEEQLGEEVHIPRVFSMLPVKEKNELLDRQA